MKDLLISLLNFFGLAWWIEISTVTPHCTYYFGPFLTAKEAAEEKTGYVEDLESEGALGIDFSIKRCKPSRLTIADDDSGKANERRTLGSAFSIQS